MQVNATVARAGDTGLLVELHDEVTAGGLLAAVRRLRKLTAPAGAIAGHSSVLLLFDHPTDAEEARTLLTGVSVLASAGEFLIDISEESIRMRTRTIEVSFAEEDAPDLIEVLGQLKVGRETFLKTLAATRLRVRFCGFLPGFAYLEGLPTAWELPRRPTSRTRVPRGSFALAAGMAGFYPDDSPGGWNIVGRASAKFWDPLCDPPALLAAGDVVKIVPVEVLRALPTAIDVRRGGEPPLLACIAPGQHTLVVSLPDTRRYKRALSAGGAFDAGLARRANFSVGNHGEACVLECTLVGPELGFERDCHVAWEGAAIKWEKNGVAIHARRMSVQRGDVVRVGRLFGGMRGWLAISGGGVAPVDPLNAAAPRRLSRGDALFSAPQPDTVVREVEFAPRSLPLVLGVIAGPHKVGDAMLEKLASIEWVVTPALDRTGVRLSRSGERVTAPATVPSCGMQCGTVQLHPNGDLVIIGPDHPITGGYQQPFTLLRSELWKVAQLQPGDRVTWKVES